MELAPQGVENLVDELGEHHEGSLSFSLVTPGRNQRTAGQGQTAR
jgi:hypothetical protein